MRISSSVTSISWIPSEAITGHMKLPFTLELTHYDVPPPDVLTHLEELRLADRFRFANVLSAWIDVDADGAVVDHGYDGGGRIGATTVRLGRTALTFPATAYPDITVEPQVGDGCVRFVQTAGGRTGAPMPRRVGRPPFVQIVAPTAWTTLGLTLHTDGRAEIELVGVSPFPRHWIYDGDGVLALKTGFVDFTTWSLDGFGDRRPWGDHDERALTAAVESAMERELSVAIMRGGEKPEIRGYDRDATIVRQGEPGREIFLVLDGMVSIEVDGEAVAEIGPGAILGERAVLESGLRTSTIRALTPSRRPWHAAARWTSMRSAPSRRDIGGRTSGRATSSTSPTNPRPLRHADIVGRSSRPTGRRPDAYDVRTAPGDVPGHRRRWCPPRRPRPRRPGLPDGLPRSVHRPGRVRARSWW